MAVIETVERTTVTLDGVEYPVVVTRRKGLDTYVDDGKTILADYATFIDYGPKMGVSRCYTLHPETEPTREEREANRRRLREVVAQCMVDQGFW